VQNNPAAPNNQPPGAPVQQQAQPPVGANQAPVNNAAQQPQAQQHVGQGPQPNQAPVNNVNVIAQPQGLPQPPVQPQLAPVQPQIVQQNNPVVAQAQPPVQIIQPGSIDSGVDLNTLSSEDQGFYALINLVSNLEIQPSDPNNLYLKREQDWQTVQAMIAEYKNNNGVEPSYTPYNYNIGVSASTSLDPLIDQNPNLNSAQKILYKKIAQDSLQFDGKVVNAGPQGGQAGVGMSGKSSRDISGVASLERLRGQYGVLNGNKAVDLMKNFTLHAISQKFPGLSDNETFAINAAATSAPQDYLNVIAASNIPNTTITQDQRDIINNEVENGNSNVNKYLAAYRALKRIENDQNGLYTEKITGRFNVKDALAYAVRVAVDAGEIQKTAINNNQPSTPDNIFQAQKDNVNNIIDSLRHMQRTYIMNNKGFDASLKTQNDINGIQQHVAKDGESCAHGCFVRAVDTMVGKHSVVKVVDTSPANLTMEFQNDVVKAFKNLPLQTRLDISTFADDMYDDINGTNASSQATKALDVQVNQQNNNVEFKLRSLQNSQIEEFPTDYKQILSNVTQDLNKRYLMLHNNPKMQLVKKDAAINVFKGVPDLYYDFSLRLNP
jgi:hypothetical protein